MGVFVRVKVRAGFFSVLGAVPVLMNMKTVLFPRAQATDLGRNLYGFFPILKKGALKPDPATDFAVSHRGQ